jgi:hypothetical protein
MGDESKGEPNPQAGEPIDVLNTLDAGEVYIAKIFYEGETVPVFSRGTPAYIRESIAERIEDWDTKVVKIEF